MKEKTSQSYSLRWYTFQIFWWSTFRLLFTGFDKSLIDTYTIGKDTYSHMIAIKEYTGDPMSYYTGFGWNKFGFEDISQFEEHVKIFSGRLSNPIVVRY